MSDVQQQPPIAGNDPQFDATIGSLDFVMSCMMEYRNAAKRGELSEPNRQTLKHHAEDMIAAGNAILETLGVKQEGLPHPANFSPSILQPHPALPCSRDCQFRINVKP